MSGFRSLGGGSGLTCSPVNNDLIPDVSSLKTKVLVGDDVFVSTTLNHRFLKIKSYAFGYLNLYKSSSG